MGYDVAVVGGGPAGMMAAICAARRGRNTVLLESNPFCGKKLRITGKGRCNVTNSCDARTVMANVPRNPKFLTAALRAFPPDAVMDFFETLGVPLKTERGNRVFPVSDNAHDIARALERELKRSGVHVREQTVRSVSPLESGGFTLESSGGHVNADHVVLATGGASYPLTGSTGDGYRFARALGHSIVPPEASLVPLASDDPVCGALQGLALRNVGVTLSGSGGSPLYREQGEMLFAHFGVTGPVILSASAHMSGDPGPFSLSIDLKPALDLETLDARVLRDFAKYANRDFANSLDDLLPKRMVPFVIARSGIDPLTKVHSVTRSERLALVTLLKHFEISVSGKRPLDEAIITSGGVEVREVNPRTMESKICPGLFIAGELLDTDAYTGGFNLQIAWCTGYLAGENA